MVGAEASRGAARGRRQGAACQDGRGGRAGRAVQGDSPEAAAAQHAPLASGAFSDPSRNSPGTFQDLSRRPRVWFDVSVGGVPAGRLGWLGSSRLHLGCISATSRLYLGCISPTSRLYLGCISAAPRGTGSSSSSSPTSCRARARTSARSARARGVSPPAPASRSATAARRSTAR